MFKQLRDLFRRTEPEEESLKLSFDGLPAWLEAREEEIERELSGATAPSREAICGTLERLREAVARMETAEGDGEVHPRLRDISRKALPGFTKSMAQILSREPTGDAEAFYATAAEILKGSLKALKGQGKYLSSVYPDEMKEVRAAVKDLGREVNTMNEPLARARDGRRQVGDVRESHASLVRIREEYAAADGQVREYGAALAVAESEIHKTEEELSALKQRPDYARKQEIEEKIRVLDAVDEEAGREMATLRTTAAHVFRKAGKVAEKAGDSAAAASIDRALDAYTDDGDDPVGPTEAAMEIVLAMIRREDLPLKNQDEVRLFSDVETLPAAMKRTLEQQRDVREKRAAEQEALAALPVVVEEQRLAAALPGLRRESEAKAAAKARAESQRETLQTSYAAETEKIRSRTAALAGRDAEVEIPDLPSP
ncbi:MULTISPECIES: hypothetical protein [Methanoculleus]|uniref:Uncharacterized protein n=2 Tax=Methanoculleus TaxID=45989 RepID=A3CVW0_METMJ|nr:MULTISPECIES: hypothetical protein [Methanoculleus]ABN57510.1 hypothetical protein Memar_1581 [Methanoculleus marisnigri JR1]MCC7554859.1 hypothetical protein [Methanoculleus marisnigri]UYU18914.1 hypothetical protein OH143_02120 [Methanoculleus submarinus]